MAETGSTILDDGALHKYRTEIPNTVVRGYKGRTLSVYAKWFYVYLKSVAGDGAECYQSTTTLAEQSGLSRMTISRAKHELLTHKLITITAGKRPQRDPDHIRIVDIWPENMHEFSQYTHQVHQSTTEVHQQTTESTSSYDSGVPGVYSSVPGGYSSVPVVDTKKIPLRRSLEEKEKTLKHIHMHESDQITDMQNTPGADNVVAPTKVKRTPSKTHFPATSDLQAILKTSIFDTAFDTWYAGTGLPACLTQPNLERQWEAFALDAQANDRTYASWRAAFQKWLSSKYQERHSQQHLSTAPRRNPLAY